MTHGAASIERRSVENRARKVSVEAKFGEECLHGRALDALALLESQIGRDEPIHDARKPDVPVGSMCLRTLEISVSHCIRPFATLGEKVTKLIGFRSGGSFEVA